MNKLPVKTLLCQLVMTVITVMHTQNFQHSFFGNVSVALSRISLCTRAELSFICKTNVRMCSVFFKNNIFFLYFIVLYLSDHPITKLLVQSVQQC